MTLSRILGRSKERRAERDRRQLVKISQMTCRRIERDMQLKAFIEGAFFGTATALFVFTVARPKVKAVFIGFAAYVLFIVLRGLVDYNRKRNRKKG